MRIIKEVTEGSNKGLIYLEEESGSRIIDMMPAGIYKLGNMGNMFGPPVPCYLPLTSKESYISFTKGTVKKVLGKVDRFFSEEVVRKHQELKIMHKTGIILYGKPGTGKTVTSHIIMDTIAKKYNAICLVITDYDIGPWLKALEELQTLNRPIILFLDECDHKMMRNENVWLTFLDGHNSLSNFIFLGCTNNLDKISTRLKRPSRIEHMIEVRSIEEEVAIQYLEDKIPNLDPSVKAGIIHYTIELESTIDVFKNAIKEFYINGSKGTVDEFKDILTEYQSYEKKELKQEDQENE